MRAPRGRTVVPSVLVVLAGLLFACTSASDPVTPVDVVRPSDAPRRLSEDVAEAWDLHRTSHARPFYALSRAELRSRYARLEENARAMDRPEFLVELMRLTARSGREAGRDGHSGVYPLDDHEPELHLYPVQGYWFPEGLFVTQSLGAGNDLVGAEVVAVEGVPIRRLIEAVEPLVPRDNEMTMRARLPQFLLTQEVLEGLGFVSRGAAELTFASGDRTFRQTLVPIGARRYAEGAGFFHPMIPAVLPHRDRPLYLRHKRRDFFLDYLEHADALYLQYNLALEPTDDIARRVERLYRRTRPGKVVVDVRHNPGGDNFTYHGLLNTLRVIAEETRVYGLVGRGTFSAAGHFVVDLVRRSDVRLVGEASGFAPNQFGDPTSTRLDASGLIVHTGAVEWIKTRRDDRSLRIMPGVPIGTTVADFFAGRDPVLDAALAD